MLTKDQIKKMESELKAAGSAVVELRVFDGETIAYRAQFFDADFWLTSKGKLNAASRNMANWSFTTRIEVLK